MGSDASKKKEEIDQKIIKESYGLINQNQLDNFYLSYNFTQNEMFTIIDEYKKICLNPNGLITPENLMDFPPFHYSPFGYHILEALDLNKDKEQDTLDNLIKKDKDKNKGSQLKLAEKESKKKSKSKSKTKSKSKSKKSNKKKKKSKKDEEEEEEEEEEINEEDITTEDQISEIPKVDLNDKKKDSKKKNDDEEGTIGIQDFVYFVYLFSSHVKVIEKAQLYFRLFDFDNDGKITPSDIIVYLENLNRSTEDVLKETKKYLTKKRKINKDDYILELSEFKNANDNKQIANLIIKESCSKGKNYMDFYDFRNMFLSMQFIPEYSCPLYLEEKFNDGRVGLVKKEEPEKKSEENNNDKDNDNKNETQDMVVPVKDIIKDNPKEEKKTEQETNNKKTNKGEEEEEGDEEEEEEDDDEEEKEKKDE